MPTILDELVIRLGLDSRTFQTQVQQTRASLGQVGSVARREASTLEDYLKKTQTETGRRMVQIEQVGRQVGQQFSNIKSNVLGLLATVSGAYGLQQFVSTLVSSDAALGNFSKALGLNVEDVATWIEMGKRAGTSAESMKTAIASLSQVKQDWALKGIIPTLPQWQGLGIDPRDKSEFELLKQISEFVKSHPPELSRALLQPLGISPDMIPLLMKGRAELDKLEVAMRALGVASAKSAEEDQNFLNKLADIRQVVQDVGRIILSDLYEPIMKVLEATKAWIVVNKNWIEQDISKFFIQFSKSVSEIPKHFEDWKTTMETLAVAAGPFFIAMTAGFSPILAAVLALTTALTLLKTQMDPKEYPIGSPFFRDMPEEEQLKYPNSPASIKRNGYPGGGSGSWLLDKMRGIFGGGGGAGGASNERKATIRDKLSGDTRLGISPNAASGLVSNLNAESGIRGINEANGGPGFGWTQWTDTQGSPRRTNFMNFSKGRGLDPASDEANYEFLVEELRTRYPQILAQLRRGDITASEAASIVARGYVVPPADKIPGHVADAENVAKLPTTMPKVGPVFGSQAPPVPPTPQAPPTLPVPPLPPPPAAATSPPSTDNSRTSSIETHISGPITVHTAATDAEGIAKGIGGALQRYNYVPQMNTGLA